MISYFLFHVTIKYIWFLKNITVAYIIHNLFFLHYMSGILNMNRCQFYKDKEHLT